MIDIGTVQGVLIEAGFSAALAEVGGSLVVSFEDEAVMGFVCLFSSPKELLGGWEHLQRSLLSKWAPSLRTAGEKAWNVYCCFLCRSPGDAQEVRQVRWIEEDLNQTRKISACDIVSREDVVRALLPIMPLQYSARLQNEDLARRFESRLRHVVPDHVGVILNEDIAAEEVVRLLGERT